MKKRMSTILISILLIFLAGSFAACGGSGGQMSAQEWQTQRESGGYSGDYLLTPGRKFCTRLAEDGSLLAVYDSESGNRCGTLDFAARSDAGLLPDFTLDLLEFSDHDGDGYSDFGIPMADGSLVWYGYKFGSNPEKEDDCFRFLDVQPDAYLLPTDSDSASSGAVG